MKLNRSHIRRLIIAEIKNLKEEKEADVEVTEEDRVKSLANKILKIGGFEPEPLPNLYFLFKDYLIELIHNASDDLEKDMMLTLDDAANGNMTELHNMIKKLKSTGSARSK
jgi:hypothetical protein